MAASSPAIDRRLARVKNSLTIPNSASKLQPITADANRNQGKNVHGAIIDELHVHADRTVWEVLNYGRTARRQPLLVSITTAGYDRTSICWEQHEHGERVLEGSLVDDKFFAFIAGLDKDDDWEDERNWIKANPNLGVSAKLEELRDMANEAKQMPGSLNGFLRYSLNVWTEQDSRVIPMDQWRAAVDKNADPAKLAEQMERELRGERCFGGLDLGAKQDLNAEALIFPPVPEKRDYYIALLRFWLPEDTIKERVKEKRVPYDVWVRQGFIRATPGNVIDHAFIKKQILEDATNFQIEELAYDPFNATQLAVELTGENVPMVELRQTTANLSEATKALLALVASRKFHHLGNPVLTWNAANLVVDIDAGGYMRPNKKKSAEKIDGISAVIDGLARAIVAPVRKKSKYENEDMVTL
jgi:phage terminase large subunit-like protein